MIRILMMVLFTVAQPVVVMAAEAAGHNAEESGGNVMAGTLAQSVAAIVIFLVLLAILWKYAWGPILSGLQDRETKIREDLESAQQANAKSQATLAEYEKKLAEARAESRRYIEQARADAETLRAKLTDQTEQEIARLRRQATDQIRLARQQAVQELYVQVAGLTADMAAKVLQRQINEDDARRLVEQSLTELENMN